MAPRFIIYSSCNAQTMAKDIRELPGYRIERVQLFDMFPHTAHYEVLTLLVKFKYITAVNFSATTIHSK